MVIPDLIGLLNIRLIAENITNNYDFDFQSQKKKNQG
jgi:hypothetical protein